MCLYRILVLFFLIFQCLFTYGQQQSNRKGIQRFALGIEQGLSNNDVNCLYQARSGDLWIGTFDGLNQYNAYNFAVVRKDVTNSFSLPGNRIQSIGEDICGNILISTMDSVVGMNPLLQTVFPIAYQRKANDPPLRLTGAAVFKLQDEVSYIGSSEKGFLCKSSHQQNYEQIPLQLGGDLTYNFSVAAMTSDRNGRIWVLIKKIGLGYFDSRSRRIMLVDRMVTDGNHLLIDDQQCIYIATDEGILVRSRGAQAYQLERFPKAVLHVLLDRANSVWASTDGEGIYIKEHGGQGFKKAWGVNRESGLASNAVKQVLQDREGRYWCATLRGGITVLDPRSLPFGAMLPKALDRSLAEHFFVSAIAEADANKLWIGSDGYGLFLWNRTDASLSPVASAALSDHSITKIVQDRKGDLWVSTWNDGVFRLDSKGKLKGHFRCYDPYLKMHADNVWNMFLDANGTIWASTFGQAGLYQWDIKADKFVLKANLLGNILCSNQDAAGKMWFGTDNQLICFDPVDRSARRYTLGYRVRSIYFDGDQVWVGTEGRGLLALNTHTGKFVAYDETSGLSNNNVLSILSDAKNNLWLSTFNGLTKFNLLTKKSQRFTVADGLQSNQFSYQAALKLGSGEMIVGGIRGINFFHPEELTLANVIFPPQLSQVSINNVPLKNFLNTEQKTQFIQAAALTLPIDQNISLEFSSFPFFSTSNISYEAKLLGYDKAWVSLGEVAKMNFNKLPAGEYQLMVKAISKNGTWKISKLLEVFIVPPWYLRAWAYLLYASILFLAIYSFFTLRRKRMMLTYETKIAQLELEKEKEIGKKKMDSFAEIIHEIKIPLTMILNPLKSLLKGELKADLQLNVAYKNANRLYALAEQFSVVDPELGGLGNIELEKLEFNSWLKQEIESFASSVEDIAFKLVWAVDADHLCILADRKKIGLAFFKLFSLLLQHSKQLKNATVSVSSDEEKVMLSIYGVYDEADHESAATAIFPEEINQEKIGNQLGVGFSLTKALIKKHQGELFVRMENERIHFRIHLPTGDWVNDYYADKSADKQVKYHANEAYSVDHVALIGYPEDLSLVKPLSISDKPSILIIDENSAFKSYLHHLLIDQYRVFEADNTIDASKVLEKENLNLIISEVFLDGSGYALCRKIKKEDKKNTLVLLMSTMADSDNQIKAIECGADQFIAKPFDQELFLSKIRSLIEHTEAKKITFFEEITQKSFYQTISSEEKEFLESCVNIINQHLLDPAFNAQTLAVACHMSYSNLYKKVRSLTGLAVSAFVRSVRLQRAAELLLKTDLNINQICAEIGIQDVKYFRVKFKELYGVTPSVYMRKYRKYFNLSYNVTAFK